MFNAIYLMDTVVIAMRGGGGYSPWHGPQRRLYKMRFYTDFNTAINEIRRDIKEMGINIRTKSVQNIDLTKGDSSGYDSLELQNYIYTVTEPDFKTIPLKNPEWCEAEFNERVSRLPLNPGKAWTHRREYWEQFLSKRTHMFDYSYPERITESIDRVIHVLTLDNNTRRAYLPVFDITKDKQDWLNTRIPCSLGYWFNYRQDRLNMTYMLRSSDFGEHFNNDIYLANRLQHYVSLRTGLLPGHFTHWIGSLHVFQKDVEHVF